MARTIKKVQANKRENQKRQKNPQQMKVPKHQAVNNVAEQLEQLRTEISKRIARMTMMQRDV